MANLGTFLYTLFCGNHVGSDQFGNKYYETRQVVRNNRKRRWVIYKGMAEPTKVPPQWHAWLHYTVNTPPASNALDYSWQKEHIPNLTGTALAYRPPGDVTRGRRREKATGDYEPWQP